MKSPLQEHICCVRSNFVNKIAFAGTCLLRTQTICAGKIFSGTFTLRTQTICAGKYFSGTFTLRTQTICAGKIFSGTFTLRTQTNCAGKFFSGTFTLRTQTNCACLLRKYYTALLPHPLINTALHGAPSHPPRLIGCAHRKYLPSGTSDSLMPSSRTISRASRI